MQARQAAPTASVIYRACIWAVRVGFTVLLLPLLSFSLLELLVLALESFPAGNCPPAV